ncbi:MAG TPA: hypothetical protein VF910_07235 [Candidatus Bathyarchaeia archaeon]
MLEQVFLKGGFGGIGTGFDPFLQILPFLIIGMFLLIIFSMFDQMTGGGFRIRFWKKKKRS